MLKLICIVHFQKELFPQIKLQSFHLKHLVFSLFLEGPEFYCTTTIVPNFTETLQLYYFISISFTSSQNYTLKLLLWTVASWSIFIWLAANLLACVWQLMGWLLPVTCVCLNYHGPQGNNYILAFPHLPKQHSSTFAPFNLHKHQPRLMCIQ